MALRIFGDWRVLFKYAAEEGQARLEYQDWPIEDNRIALEEAERRHNEYRDICLEADGMIGMEV